MFLHFFEFLVQIFYFMQKCHKNVREKFEANWTPQPETPKIHHLYKIDKIKSAETEKMLKNVFSNFETPNMAKKSKSQKSENQI